MSTIKSVLLFAFVLSFGSSFANSFLGVYLVTGNDGLRSGNHAYVTVNYADGTSSPEYRLPHAYGLSTGPSLPSKIALNKTVVSANEIKSVLLRHDGAPRQGEPFDTYDNWDLQSIRITVFIGGEEVEVCNKLGNPLVRFTGNLRTYVLSASPPPPANTTNKVKVYFTTGGDNLRSNSRVIMIVNYTDGTTSPEIDFGGGFGQNMVITRTATISKSVENVSAIKSITIGQDGAPRQWFESYDNWDLQALRVVLIMPNGIEKNIINESGNPLIRFTGSVRHQTWLRR
ncbi:MAG: hypothetical protein K9J37_04415 [Saprospiraceae bacterium]|nr:hypothetical protein [Saprospiraceae bacterium]MCF8249129.1 hypothetical protein [Saprospiraceae bacterium]MCF8281386.1 hypothetical protein [Bacteroidales bacterium]MCF8311151.1 hypothetical protein [Saprospiraceae bacterium]MCF8440241.1 hypothetical protein [Saprospiraceae bacterium]